MANKLVTCPYDEVHKVKESRLAMHITKCRLNNLGAEKFTCPFNASHIYPIQEKSYHLTHCPDKAVVDRALVHNSLEQNNIFKGNTSVPSYTASVPVMCDEIWDDGVEYIEPAPGFVPPKPPPCAILEPPALSKPAERRKLYQELHKRPETENIDSKPQINARQPKASSEVENRASSEFRSLGLGRGRAAAVPPSRIAANFFTPPPGPQSPATNNINYSAALSGMRNLGLGRGFSATSADDNLLDDDFPALGCGRGVYKTTHNDIRYPGSRS